MADGVKKAVAFVDAETHDTTARSKCDELSTSIEQLEAALKEAAARAMRHCGRSLRNDGSRTNYNLRSGPRTPSRQGTRPSPRQRPTPQSP